MAEELGTRDVLEQVHTRLGTLEQDVRSLNTKMDARFDRLHQEIGGLRSEMKSDMRGFRTEIKSDMHGYHSEIKSDMNGFRTEMNRFRSETQSEMNGFRSEVNARFDTTIRWLAGIIFASWMTLMAAMASIWLKLGN